MSYIKLPTEAEITGPLLAQYAAEDVEHFPEDATGTPYLTHAPNVQMLLHAWDVLISVTHGLPKPKSSALFNNSNVDGLFVTLKKISERGETLRGCIGYMSRIALSQLGHYVSLSALKDARFPAVKPVELPILRLTISILSNFEQTSDLYDWDIGTHGVKVKFTYRGEKMSATFLPEIAEDQRWSKHLTLLNLAKKAGAPHLNGVQDLEFTRYQSRRMSMTYEEYILKRESLNV